MRVSYFLPFHPKILQHPNSEDKNVLFHYNEQLKVRKSNFDFIGLSHLPAVFRFHQMPQKCLHISFAPDPEFSPGSCAVLSCPVSLISFHLEYLLHLSWSSMTLALLKISGQLSFSTNSIQVIHFGQRVEVRDALSTSDLSCMLVAPVIGAVNFDCLVG